MSDRLQRRRRFSSEDQGRFASLSGDYNPLHLDPVLARRLMFGTTVVHGLHLLLWTLDEACAADPSIRSIGNLTAHFDSAVPVGAEVTLDLVPGPEARATLTLDGRRAARLRFTPSTEQAAWVNPGFQGVIECQALGATEIAAAHGAVALGFDLATAATLFPHLGAFAAGQLAWLLASTRVVGMLAPGRDSVFVGLSATFDGSASATLSYRTERYDERFDLADIALSSGRATGRASALRRPVPVMQVPLSEVSARVAPGRFENASAIVVGGTRGLGEAAAKIIAAGGGTVTVTYHQGAAEAAALNDELQAAARTPQSIRMDARAPSLHETLKHAPFSHVFYCAAPRIRKGSSTFSQALLDEYRAIFVTGLRDTLAVLELHLADDVTLLVPSTIYVEKPVPGFAEYAQAKAEGEDIARQFADRLRDAGRKVTLLQPRFDRLRTDQTAAPGPVEAEDPVDALLRVLA